MNETGKKNNVEAILDNAFGSLEVRDISVPMDIAKLGQIIKKNHPEFSPHEYGHEKLRSLLDEFPEVIKLIKDDTVSPPRYLAKYLKTGRSDVAPNVESLGSPIQITAKPAFQDSLRKFGLIISARWKELAALARHEDWGGDNVPLLRNYIRHTYTRLVHEDKVKVASGGDAAVFNTGLVDNRYQPIFAFFVQNKRDTAIPWFLESFCIAGENTAGKKLVRTFSQTPEAAYYFDDPSDAIYDVTADAPYIDWEHIIEENPDRLPTELLLKTTSFKARPCDDMSEEEREKYKQEFSNFIRDDGFAYRVLINTFKAALDLALKQVRWNYKAAIPIYYPAFDRLSILLPLCLLSDDHVDLALVVERTESGNYQGQTVFPLDWAYKNARLIARPESDWLRLDKFAGNNLSVEPDDEA